MAQLAHTVKGEGEGGIMEVLRALHQYLHDYYYQFICSCSSFNKNAWIDSFSSWTRPDNVPNENSSNASSFWMQTTEDRMKILDLKTLSNLTATDFKRISCQYILETVQNKRFV